METISQPRLLPSTPAELRQLGWGRLDVLLVTGDAHVDHPAFGAALLGRWLVAHGLRVGVVAQPRWDRPDDVARLGRPRLMAGVTAGALDSMLAHYTAFRKKRHDDAYTPGGRSGARPNRACITYAGLVRQAFPGLPVVLGGIEASLRRASHYDFWTDRLRRSILLDSKADLVLHGMAERSLLQAARRLAEGGRQLQRGDGHVQLRGRGDRRALSLLWQGVDGGVTVGRETDLPSSVQTMQLPSHEEIEGDPRRLMDATLALERQLHQGTHWALQGSGDRVVLHAPPAAPLAPDQLDRLYGLPFSRLPHPCHGDAVIKAEQMVRFSITSHRGCAGGCSFCSLALHQGRRIRSRSRRSVLHEARTLTGDPRWRGSLSDVGGPTANNYAAHCADDAARCSRVSCLFPTVCKNFRAPQGQAAKLLSDLGELPGVRHVRVASGVRHDLACQDLDYVARLVQHHTGGQLKLAPEHVCDDVLRLMRKPPVRSLERFLALFEEHSARAGKQQYVVPYLMSAFPGCTDAQMRKLAAWLRRRGWRPRQVQCFIPTPGTVATAMYHAGVDARMRAIQVAKSDARRLRQHRILLGEVK